MAYFTSLMYICVSFGWSCLLGMNWASVCKKDFKWSWCIIQMTRVNQYEIMIFFRLTSWGFTRGDAPRNGLHATHQGLDEAATVRHLKRLLVLLLTRAIERCRRGLGRSGYGSRGSRRWEGGGGGWSRGGWYCG